MYMEIKFLGVHMVSDSGNTVSFVLKLKTGEKILVDSGVDTVKSLIEADIDPCSITHMVITHSHGDHIAGIPMYLFYRYKYAPIVNKVLASTMHIISSKETWDAVKKYIEIPYRNLSEDSHLIVRDDICDRSIVDINTRYTMEFFSVNHKPVTHGFRIIDHLDNKSVVYSADTGICDIVFEMAQNADCLIHDTVADSRFPMFGRAGHSLCADVSKKANEVGVKVLIPVHRLSIYDNSDAQYAEEIRANYTGKLIIPTEGSSIQI